MRWNLLPFLVASSFCAIFPFLALDASAQAPRRTIDTLDQRTIGKLDQRLARSIRAGDRDTKRVIIRTTASGIPGLTGALRAKGHSVLRSLRSINAVTAQIPVAALRELSQLASVESISIDAVVRAEDYSSDSTLRGTLGLPTSTPGGDGVGVAVIDSGLEPSLDFEDRIVAFHDFTEGGRAEPPSDDYGHGTHVAGLIGGDGGLSNRRYRGVAHKSRLIGLKVLDENGAGYTSDVINAIEFATANKDQLGIHVINLSLGHPILEPAATDPLVQAVEAAARAGIIVVVAAGNYGVSSETGEPGYAGILSPGNAPSAITVGSVRTWETDRRSDDRVAEYSSRGPTWYDGTAKPDLVAPGHGLVSLAAKSGSLYLDNPELRVGRYHLRLSGTSMATAVVSGTAALIVQAHRDAFPWAPPLTPNAVKAILQYTALPTRTDAGDRYDYLTQGTGSVNASGAIELAAHIDTSAPVSSTWLVGEISTSTVIDNETLSWAGNIMWADAVGSGIAVYVNDPAWSQNIIWGSSIEWDDNIIWGNNIIWDDNIIWGNNIIWGSSLIGVADGGSTAWGTVPDSGAQASWGSLAGTSVTAESILITP
jgi:serine protease AprX